MVLIIYGVKDTQAEAFYREAEDGFLEWVSAYSRLYAVRIRE